MILIDITVGRIYFDGVARASIVTCHTATFNGGQGLRIRSRTVHGAKPNTK